MFEDDENHMKSEKKIHQITFKVGESLFTTLSTLANRKDQALSELVRSIVEDHIYGVSKRLEMANRKQ
jgi:ribosomal protein L6P/L9E